MNRSKSKTRSCAGTVPTKLSILVPVLNEECDLARFVRALTERINRIRFRLTRIIYGDHGIFISRKNYDHAGGFGDLPLFEDVDLSKRLRKLGRICLANPPIVTSARRFPGRRYS